MAQHTRGPWDPRFDDYVREPRRSGVRFEIEKDGFLIQGVAAACDDECAGQFSNDVARANARLIAAAPLLELIAELVGRYAWEALSENFHHDLTKQRKADLLAAYRAYTGYRDGRMTMTEAWAEVSEIAKAALAPLPTA